MKTLKDFDFENKRVLLRCDFQVPLDEEGSILDGFKIKSAIPTIEYLIEKKAKVILMSHWRPAESEKKAESLIFILPIIEELLKKRIKFLDDCLGKKTKREVAKMRSGEIVLLENLRFHKEEEANDDGFARQLAMLGDIYINDAFGVSHRPHASLIGVPKYLPSGAGFLLEKEINALNKIMESPEKPLIAIVGGAKVETKTAVIDKISQNADFVLIGGLIACEIKEKNINFANSWKIVFPVADVCAFDIDERTINLFKEKIKKAKTIFWTGPLGKVEEKEFKNGTLEIARAIIESGAYSVAGGGETAWFLGQSGLINKFNHVSTGGGAMLAFLAGEKLPGIEALEY
ncbi:MAG: phosphoglycerate kinase [Candidatus Wildermuthbacteria bacterium]|nr:phosphoglycerate kinase [Candidatus Wildermuthbacteria bacterium]